MANNFITPQEGAKRITKALNKVWDEQGVPEDKRADLAVAIFQPLHKFPHNKDKNEDV
jgi:hypothetical protein